MKTWVVVANAARARFLAVRDNSDAYRGSQAFPSSKPAPKGELEEVESLANPAGRLADAELETDRPGATKDRKGEALHAYEPPTSVGDMEAKRFAREVMGELEQARHAGRMDRFYLVAAPGFLGQLREFMDKPLQEALVADEPKDLSGLSTADIRDALPERL